MPPKILPITASALHEILKWSANRPEWQRDALRRIVSQETLEDADLAELDRLCRSKHNADTSKDKPIILQPLAAAHLPPAPGAASSVTLVSVGNLHHVNRLPSSEIVTFGAPKGLTIVFGDNGSGKSGYARVVKRACRTRGVPPAIRPDAFQPHPKSPATADIEFQVAGSNHTFNWTDGAPSDPRLANVFVFDASTAGNYLHEDGPAAFTPHGLDVLPKLSKTCDLVGALIQKDMVSLNLEIVTAAKNWKYVATTKVGELVSSLSATSKASDIDLLALLSADKSQRLRDLNEALKSDPKQKARETRASAARLRAFATKIAAMAREMSPPNCLALRNGIEGAATTAAAARAFASGTFDETYLPATGSALWRALFDAALSYSTTEAYEGRIFPFTQDGARCVLCQQPVGTESRTRLQAFDAFCKDTSQQLASEAAARLEQLTDAVNLLQAAAPEQAKVEADLSVIAPDDKTAVDSFVKQCDSMLTAVKSSLASCAWTDPGLLPPSPESMITAAALALDKRAEMEESADDPAARAKLTNDRDELAMKEWLASVKDDVILQIARHQRIALLKTCQADTSTSAITKKNTELTKSIVTDAFCKRFEDEVVSLGLCTISVRMEEIKGKKGETSFGPRLKDAANHKVHEIAREGEQRCIALAAFLAELSQASHHSSLVFDDPVSSLDHGHHLKIADRLIEEAAARQVIVFTHSTSFLHDLQQAASVASMEPHILHLEWEGGLPGWCREGLPWDWKSAKDRFEKLERRQRELRDSWNPLPNENNVQEMRRAYSWLRATLERIVEKEVFADVVLRFRIYIKVQSLSSVVGFASQECEEIQRLMKRCHDVTEAHDPSVAKHGSIPDPAAFLKDINDTRAVLELIQTRKNSLRAKAAATPGHGTARP